MLLSTLLLLLAIPKPLATDAAAAVLLASAEDCVSGVDLIIICFVVSWCGGTVPGSSVAHAAWRRRPHLIHAKQYYVLVQLGAECSVFDDERIRHTRITERVSHFVASRCRGSRFSLVWSIDPLIAAVIVDSVSLPNRFSAGQFAVLHRCILRVPPSVTMTTACQSNVDWNFARCT